MGNTLLFTGGLENQKLGSDRNRRRAVDLSIESHDGLKKVLKIEACKKILARADDIFNSRCGRWRSTLVFDEKAFRLNSRDRCGGFGGACAPAADG